MKSLSHPRAHILLCILLAILSSAFGRKSPVNPTKLPSLLKNENNIAFHRHKRDANKFQNRLLQRSNKSNALVKLDLCGGGCDDSNPILFLKISLSAVVETAALVAIIVGSTHLSSSSVFEKIPSIGGLSPVQWAALVLVIFFPSIIGSLIDGGLSAASKQILMPQMNPGDPDWYSNLKKPSWNPPGWVFPIMWLIVSKPTQLVAVSKILKSSSAAVAENTAEEVIKNALPISVLLVIYCSQLALGDAWNKVFFGLQCTGRGAAVITVFWGLLFVNAYLFGTVGDGSAGLFMLPTCAWVTVATALNWNIYLNN